jgi:hypothetical protein
LDVFRVAVVLLAVFCVPGIAGFLSARSDGSTLILREPPRRRLLQNRPIPPRGHGPRGDAFGGERNRSEAMLLGTIAIADRAR